MVRIPVISSSPEVHEVVRQGMAPLAGEMCEVALTDKESAIEYIKYELPDIKIIDCADRGIDAIGILDIIREDPWLHYGGIVATYDDEEQKEAIFRLRESNIIAILTKREFTRDISRLLRILNQNKHFLFQRGMQQNLMSRISGRFEMNNDPLDITVYSNLVTNYLYNTNLLNREDRDRLHVALQELLINAIEHGNCEISFAEKSAWLEAGNDAMDLIRLKNQREEISDKKVLLQFTISPSSSTFSIRDEGNGFDWRAWMAAKPELGLHGMGIKMANVYVKDLTYNDQGNEVFFSVSHQKDAANDVPAIFTDSEDIALREGDIIARQGDESDSLFYIVTGRFDVFADGKYVSSLTPEDMFIGEMSFLLSNQRSATVVASGEGKVIRILKQDFLDMIKTHPHYGIFLARLLAQRLMRVNSRVAILDTELAKAKSDFTLSCPHITDPAFPAR